MGTPLSSSCQLELGVDLSHHKLEPYTWPKTAGIRKKRRRES